MLRALFAHREELIALGKMGNFFGLNACSSYRAPAFAENIYYYILIYKLSYPSYPRLEVRCAHAVARAT